MQKNRTLINTDINHPAAAASVMRRIVIVRTKGSAIGFSNLSALDSAFRRQTTRQSATSAAPSTVSAASTPSMNMVQYQLRMIPRFKA